jgi:DUF3006 family protein
MPDSANRWVVDSIEESMASVEVDGKSMITVPQSLLPSGARQGHVLRVKRELSADGLRSVLTIELDDAATKRALAASAAQVKKGVKGKNDPGGDITL